MSNFVNTPSISSNLKEQRDEKVQEQKSWGECRTTKGEAEDMQELVQEEAGDQIQEEQHKGWVEGGGAEV